MKKLKYISYYANDKEVMEGIRFTRNRWRHIKEFVGDAASGLKIPPDNDKGWKAVCNIQTFAKKHRIAEGEYILKRENGDVCVATPNYLKDHYQKF